MNPDRLSRQKHHLDPIQGFGRTFAQVQRLLGRRELHPRLQDQHGGGSLIRDADPTAGDGKFIFAPIIPKGIRREDQRPLVGGDDQRGRNLTSAPQRKLGKISGHEEQLVEGLRIGGWTRFHRRTVERSAPQLKSGGKNGSSWGPEKCWRDQFSTAPAFSP